MTRVCPSCYRPAPARISPKGFVCQCFEPKEGSRRERRHLEAIATRFGLNKEQARRLAELKKKASQ